MYSKLVRKAKNNKGFTLIELIVVIAIIAILALILVPRFTGYTANAAERTNATNRRTIETAVNVMLADGRLSGTGEFSVTPGASGGIVIDLEGTHNLDWQTSPDVAPADATNGVIQTALVALIGDRLTPAGEVTAYNVVVSAGNVEVEDITP